MRDSLTLRVEGSRIARFGRRTIRAYSPVLSPVLCTACWSVSTTVKSEL